MEVAVPTLRPVVVVGCLEVALTPAQRETIDAIADFAPGFPASFLHSNHVRKLNFGDTFARLDRHRYG